MNTLPPQPAIKQPPTPEFNQDCAGVLQNWREGQITFREAVALMNRYLQQAVASGHRANQGCAEHTLGILQGQRGNLESSLLHLALAHELYQQTGNTELVARADMGRGIVWLSQGNLPASLELFRAIYQTAVTLEDRYLQLLTTQNEGVVLDELGQHAAAQSAYERALQLAEQWEGSVQQKSILLCSIHASLATLHQQLNEPEVAWRHALLAQEIAQQENFLLLQGYAHRAIAQLVAELEPPPDANLSTDSDGYFQKALSAFQALNAEVDIANTVFYHACSLAKRGERLAALRKFQQAVLIYNRLGMVRDATLAAEAQLEFL